MASDKKLTIRVSAEDAGVARVMREIQKSTSDTMKSVREEAAKPVLGPQIKPRFSFEEQLIRNETARIVRRMQEEARRHKVKVQAEVIVKEARSRVFGDGRGPLRTVSRTAEEQAIRDRQAQLIREMAQGARRARIDAAANEALFGAARKPLRSIERSDDEQLIRDRQARRLRAIREEARAVREEQSRSAKTFGVGAGFKNTFSILRGGGAALGINLAARTIADAAEEAAKLREELRSGAIAAGDIPDRLAPTIPILGNIWRAGRAVRELFTEDAAEAAKVTAEAEKVNRIIAARIELQKQSQKADRESRERVRTSAQQERIANESNRYDRFGNINKKPVDDLKAFFDLENETRKRNSEKKEAIEALKKESDVAKELTAAQEALRKHVIPPMPTKPLPPMEGEFALADDHYKQDVAKHEEALSEQQRLNDRIKALQNDLAREEVKINERAQNEKRQANQTFTAEQKSRAREEAKEFQESFRKAVANAKEFAGDFAKEVKERFNKGIKDNEKREATLREGRIEALEAEADLGNHAAKIEAEKLRIAEEYRKKRIEINAILRDESASDAQKKRARDELDALNRTEKRALQRVGVDTSPRRFASLIDSQSISGIGESMRSTQANLDPFAPVVEAAKQQAQTQKQNTEAIKEHSRLLLENNNLLRSGTTIQPLFLDR